MGFSSSPSLNSSRPFPVVDIVGQLHPSKTARPRPSHDSLPKSDRKNLKISQKSTSEKSDQTSQDTGYSSLIGRTTALGTAMQHRNHILSVSEVFSRDHLSVKTFSIQQQFVDSFRRGERTKPDLQHGRELDWCGDSGPFSARLECSRQLILVWLLYCDPAILILYFALLCTCDTGS